MKAVIAIVIVALLGFVGFKVWEYWTQTEKDKPLTQPVAEVQPQSLPGLPSQLESRLEEAKNRGPDTFKEFIDSIKKSPLVKDPRLAWIELDYVVMIAGKDPAEAKRLFAKVKERTPPDSPVYARIKSLEKTFE
jgi:hypothetical protein